MQTDTQEKQQCWNIYTKYTKPLIRNYEAYIETSLTIYTQNVFESTKRVNVQE